MSVFLWVNLSYMFLVFNIPIPIMTSVWYVAKLLWFYYRYRLFLLFVAAVCLAATQLGGLINRFLQTHSTLLICFYILYQVKFSNLSTLLFILARFYMNNYLLKMLTCIYIILYQVIFTNLFTLLFNFTRLYINNYSIPTNTYTIFIFTPILLFRNLTDMIQSEYEMKACSTSKLVTVLFILKYSHDA